MQPDAAAPKTAGESAVQLVERPAPGLARGKYAAPAWLIGLLGFAVLAVVVAYFAIRVRRARRSSRKAQAR